VADVRRLICYRSFGLITVPYHSGIAGSPAEDISSLANGERYSSINKAAHSCRKYSESRATTF